MQKDPRVSETAGTIGMFMLLQECAADLEKISEGVAAYLEKKRLLFPRWEDNLPSHELNFQREDLHSTA